MDEACGWKVGDLVFFEGEQWPGFDPKHGYIIGRAFYGPEHDKEQTYAVVNANMEADQDLKTYSRPKFASDGVIFVMPWRVFRGPPEYLPGTILGIERDEVELPVLVSWVEISGSGYVYTLGDYNGPTIKGDRLEKLVSRVINL